MYPTPESRSTAAERIQRSLTEQRNNTSRNRERIAAIVAEHRRANGAPVAKAAPIRQRTADEVEKLVARAGLTGDDAAAAVRKLRFGGDTEFTIGGITFRRDAGRVSVRSSREKATVRIITAPADVAASFGLTKKRQ